MKSLQSATQRAHVGVSVLDKLNKPVKSQPKVEVRSGVLSKAYRLRRHPLGGTIQQPMTEAGAKKLVMHLQERGSYQYVKRWPVWGNNRKGDRVLRGWTVWVGRAA